MDEGQCAAALRNIIAPPTNEVPGSIYEADVEDRPDSPLRDEERVILQELDFPGALEIIPDVPPGPGVPVTTIRFSGQSANSHLTPRLRFNAFAGFHELEIRFADERNLYCVEMSRCETIRVRAHASLLDRHPAIQSGPCLPALASFSIEPTP
jgi:hypothetical protein